MRHCEGANACLAFHARGSFLRTPSALYIYARAFMHVKGSFPAEVPRAKHSCFSLLSTICHRKQLISVVKYYIE